MKKTIKYFWLAAVVIIFVSTTAEAFSLNKMNKTKKPSKVVTPNAVLAQEQNEIAKLVLKTLDNQELKLSDYAGKVLIIDFFATWCPPCRAGIPHFVALQNEMGKKGVQIIGISVDQGAVSDVAVFVKENKVNYPVAMTNLSAEMVFGSINSIPTTFVVDKNMKIVKKIVGYKDQAFFNNLLKPLI